MKTTTLGILAAGALLGATLATAGMAQDRQRAPDDRAGLAPPRNFIARFDTDADGRVSLAEFVDARLRDADRHFERRDRDGDGLISATEAAPPAGPERGRRGARPERPRVDEGALRACIRETVAGFEPLRGSPGDAFAATDTDADGALSLQEVNAALERRAQEQFGRLDTDGDGYVTAAEAEARRKEQRELQRSARECLRVQRRR